MIDTNKWSCKRCLIIAMSSVTNDQTAISDVKRAHVAFERGYDRTRANGTTVVVPFAQSRSGISYGQSLEWSRKLLEAGMKIATMSVYRYTFDRAWTVVNCFHEELNGSVTSDIPIQDTSSNLSTEYKSSDSSISNDDPIAAAMTALLGVGNRVGGELVKNSQEGFRLSVAQKNLSLILKWAWINGMIPMPPVCPVDRIMLDRASRITGLPWSVNWTSVNSLEEWNSHFDHLLRAAGEIPVAAWEIIQFEDDSDASKASFRDRQAREILDRLLKTESSAIVSEDFDAKIEAAKISFMARFGKGGPGHDEWPYDMLTDALKSSLQHNPTYRESTSDTMRSEIRHAMKRWGIDFLARWRDTDPAGQTVERFRDEIVSFRNFMNDQYGPYFR